MSSWMGATEPLAQMNGRYPKELADHARGYAFRHRLSLKVVLSAALAEYLAKRSSGDADPTPQLHYRPGRPPAEIISFQRRLMVVDPRGRKLRPPRRTLRARREQAQEPRVHLALNAGDGGAPQSDRADAELLRAQSSRPTPLRPSNGEALPLAV